MDNMAASREWRRLADTDLKSAEYLVNMYPAPIEIICYHCQQSAEKYLKAYLVLNGTNPPKIHDLNVLNNLCKNINSEFEKIADQCSDLTSYGTQPRYPMTILLEKSDMQTSLKHAKTIRSFFLKIAPEMMGNSIG